MATSLSSLSISILVLLLFLMVDFEGGGRLYRQYSLRMTIYYRKYTAKNQTKNWKQRFPRKGIARPQSPSPHSCVRGRFIYSHDRSAYYAAGNMWTDPGTIIRSQTHKFENWDWGRAFPRKGIHKWDFHCSVLLHSLLHRLVERLLL